ncbi:hypothetical protein J3B01_000553 [Coemansia erecta]|nr:hypothetical protein J3B01_000553 [Coemansia erecta]
MLMRIRYSLLTLLLLMMSAVAGQRAVPGDPYTVGQSPRGLVIDGQPRVLTTGAIHYPRSAPAMWDSLMKKAKLGGLNTIDTYVFWNMHEPSKGDYDFYTDRANLPLFLQTARENGLFVVLRVGPYVCAEWNYGGFPQWLRHEPDIVFRTYSAPFMREMRRFIAKVVDVTKPYMPEHGGPIIAMQIENEYGDHQRDFGHNGDLFADWCGQTAQQFNLTVPWIMCQQYYRVDGVIPTVNGFYCDQKLDKFRRDNPELPAMWTEMWPGWFQRWGEAAPHRPIEDIAYAVAKWFARGGTSVSYYMYHGGTNFGRTSGPFIMTSYDYDGFIDEYGLENWPKYLHLQALHRLLLEHEQFITGNDVPKSIKLADSDAAAAYVYGTDSDYFAFLINSDSSNSIKIKFDGLKQQLPPWSVTLVRRSKQDKQPNVLYNTAQLSKLIKRAQRHPARFETISSGLSTNNIRWQPLSQAGVPTITAKRPVEQISVTDDKTDYLWYRTNVSLPAECGSLDAAHAKTLVLHDAGDVATVYFNGEFVGMQHGQQDRLATFTFAVPPSTLRLGKENNTEVEISILSQTLGMAHNQRNMESYSRGLLGAITLCGRDITKGKWEMQPGLEGEHLPAHLQDTHAWERYDPEQQLARPQQMRWYAIELDSQMLAEQASDDEPARYAIDMASMSKGHIWINGVHLGRYWLRRAPAASDYAPCRKCTYNGAFHPDRMCRQHCGELSQRYYHLPRSYLRLPKSGDGSARVHNMLYVLEELDGHPEHISIAQRISKLPLQEPEQPRERPRCSWLLGTLATVCGAAVLVGAGTLLFKALKQWRERRGYARIHTDDSSLAE